MKNKEIRIKIGRDNGMSLVETLVALFMTGLVMASVFGVYINQHKNWMIQEEVTDAQQNARAVIDELTRQTRMAGYELPLGLPGIEAYNTNPDTIVINYSADGCNATIEHDMPLPSSELRCDGHDVSCFYDGQWAYIFDPDSGGGEFFEITHVQTGSQHIQHNTMDLSRVYQAGAIILALQQVKYYIDRTDTTHPNLMIQLPGQAPQVYAENIEDLQFQYTMKNGAVLDVPTLVGDVREVIITLTARTDKPDPDFPADPYRRRTYSSKVNMRNFDI
jgi:hypothetical protein